MNRWSRRLASGRRSIDPVDDIVAVRAALAAGATAVAALAAAAETGGVWAAALGGVVTQVERGRRIDAALLAWATEADDESVTLFTEAMVMAAASGAPTGPALDAVIVTVRHRCDLGREVRALSAQARASAVVVVVAPLLFAVVVAAVDPRVRRFYLSFPSGMLCIGIGVGLDAAGGWWMTRLVRAVR